MHKFRELVVWQKTMDLKTSICANIEKCAFCRKIWTFSQIRCCGVSICSNIVKGASRNTNGEFIQFLGIANGPAYELETRIQLLNRLK